MSSWFCCWPPAASCHQTSYSAPSGLKISPGLYPHIPPPWLDFTTRETKKQTMVLSDLSSTNLYVICIYWKNTKKQNASSIFSGTSILLCKKLLFMSEVALTEEKKNPKFSTCRPKSHLNNAVASITSFLNPLKSSFFCFFSYLRSKMKLKKWCVQSPSTLFFQIDKKIDR